MKHKLLILPNYYYPDSGASSVIYTELCEDLVAYYNVTVVCTVPCYAGLVDKHYRKNKFYFEKQNEVSIIRVHVGNVDKASKKSRIKNILLYYLRAKRYIKQVGNQDVVIAGTQPPILGGRLGVYAKKKTGGKSIYYIHDFNPEQAEFTGYVKNRFLLRFMKHLDKDSCKKADMVVTSSADMQKNLEERFCGTAIPKNIVIPNWVDLQKVKPISRQKNPLFTRFHLSKGNFYISYAGNIGIMQDFPTILKAAAILKDTCPAIQFVLIGSGVFKGEMDQTVKQKELTNVHLFPMQPTGEDSILYSFGNVELISIGKNVTKCSIPSKTCKIFASGRPVLCQADLKSALVKEIESYNIGIGVQPGDAEAFANAARNLYNNRNQLSQMGKNARIYAEHHFSRANAVEQFRQAVNNLI